MKAAFLLLVFASAAMAAQQPSKRFDPRAPSNDPAFTAALPNKEVSSALLTPSSAPYRVGPGDKLDIEILGVDGTRQTSLVGPDGKLYYDLAAGIDVSALTLDDIRKELEKQLVSYYRAPEISVTVAQVRSKRVWVLGRVNKPGIYPITHPTTILDVISQAGGLFTSRQSGTTEELADLDHSFIVRGNNMLPVDFAGVLRKGDMRSNIYLEPNDLIYLPSSLSKQINVLGAVTRPRAIGFAQEMCLATAISGALGPLPEADLHRIAIVRGSLNAPKVAIVDFAAIQHGKAKDIRLEPGDIVYVPVTRVRSLGDLAVLITNTFVRSVAANEGNHAALPAAKTQPIQTQLSVQP